MTIHGHHDMMITVQQSKCPDGICTQFVSTPDVDQDNQN